MKFRAYVRKSSAGMPVSSTSASIVRKGNGNSTGVVHCTTCSASSTSKSLVSNKTVEVHGETTAGYCNKSSGCSSERLKHNKRKAPRGAPRRLMKNRTLHVARECAAVDSISVPSDGFLPG